jgi:hypothetical protein
MANQFFLQGAARLNKKDSGRSSRVTPHLRVAWILVSEPTRYLLWRPVILESNRYDPLQISVPGQQTRLRTACRLPCCPIGFGGLIALLPSVASHLLTHRRDRSVQSLGDGSK